MGFELMKERNGARALLVAPLLVSGLLVSGCMSSPTYGTGVSANEQLATDLSSMFSMKPKRSTADYAPRAELVKPANPSTELPAPQESIVTADSGQWPESPEQRRARIRAEATENRDDPNWQPGVINDIAPVSSSGKSKPVSARAQDSGVAKYGEAEDLNARGAQAKKARAVSMQGSPTVRRTLSEPPLDYRQPAATAPTDDLGEEEFKKKRRLEAEAKRAAAGGKTSLKDFVPWL